MYSKSRLKKPKDKKHSACANCVSLVKVNYTTPLPGGIFGEWHCHQDLILNGYRQGVTMEQPWTFTCHLWKDRVAEKTDGKGSGYACSPIRQMSQKDAEAIVPAKVSS